MNDIRVFYHKLNARLALYQNIKDAINELLESPINGLFD